MAKCPNCKKEIAKPKKTWKYRRFNVKAYSCGNCGTSFNEYFQGGKQSFTLKHRKGKGYVKA